MDINVACTHEHSLLSFSIMEVETCGLCGENISKSAYNCRSCDVWLHKSCASKLLNLPLEISHPLHQQPHHQLELTLLDGLVVFICDKCFYMCSESRYYSCSSSSCNFNLDLACALSVNDDPPHVQGWTKKRTLIQHYSHIHKLKFFKYTKLKKYEYACNWCEKPLSDVCYGCRKCDFYLHDSCKDKIPRTIYDHPFHPYNSHPLRLHHNSATKTYYCNACRADISSASGSSLGLAYWCQICDFRLDFNCAKFSPTLKHECHDHLLTYFPPYIQTTDRLESSPCKVCHNHLWRADSYRCVQCDVNFHLRCMSIPSSAKHRYHMHPLGFKGVFKEDDSGEYYCDACEEERDPKHPIYYCEECKFIAHIECLLNHEASSSSSSSSSATQSIGSSKALFARGMDINTQQQLLIDPIIHEHPLRFHEEATEKLKFCNACRLELSGASYICTKCPDRYTQNYDRYVQYHLDPERKFYLHEKCAKLPYEIQHPFHSSHPLNLYTKYPYIGFKICDECGDIPRGFIYLCEECNFMLDVKCAARTTCENGVSLMQLKGIDESSRHHFRHEHDLVIGNCSDPINQAGCNICELPISGQAYFCPGSSCHYIVHESCLGLPEKMQVPFHAGHMMVMRSKDNQKYPDYFYRRFPTRCHACHGFFSSVVGYECEKCHHYYLHSTCANSLRRPLMKLESHEHNLYYLGTDCQLLSANYNFPFNCSKCRKNCRGQPFYRCMECNDINFHLECVPLPHIVKSRHHIHPLTLKDSFVEDDSGEYYCDICEEERFAKDHVYYCEECKGLFLAHIECALAKVECVVSYLDGQEREESRIDKIESEPSSSDNEYDSTVNSESGYDDDE